VEIARIDPDVLFTRTALYEVLNYDSLTKYVQIALAKSCLSANEQSLFKYGYRECDVSKKETRRMSTHLTTQNELFTLSIFIRNRHFELSHNFLNFYEMFLCSAKSNFAKIRIGSSASSFYRSKCFENQSLRFLINLLLIRNTKCIVSRVGAAAAA